MSKTELKDELKKTIETKQFIQVHFHNSPGEFKVAYIIGYSEGYLALAEVNDSGRLDGISVVLDDEIDTIKIETIYLSELEKRVNKEALYKEIAKDTEAINKFSFEGFISALENSNTIVEIRYENDYTVTGRIIGQTGRSLIVDEYKAECDRRCGRCFINLESVAQISFGIPYLMIIDKSLRDKSI